MWLVMLSCLEWANLTDEQKEMHSSIHEPWVSNYAKNAEMEKDQLLPLHGVKTNLVGMNKTIFRCE